MNGGTEAEWTMNWAYFVSRIWSSVKEMMNESIDNEWSESINNEWSESIGDELHKSYVPFSAERMNTTNDSEWGHKGLIFQAQFTLSSIN